MVNEQERILQGILPPSDYRHVALTKSQLQKFAAYIDDSSPMFYLGMDYYFKYKEIAPGLYRVWMEYNNG